MIAWTDDLATGIAPIDAQHRHLYDTVNRLHDLMRRHALHEVDGILGELAAYAAEHFGAEERVMEEAGYPGLAAHRNAHLAFVAEFVQLRAGLTPVPTTSGVVDLSAWLGDWLREHVRRMDGAMARYVREHASDARPAA